MIKPKLSKSQIRDLLQERSERIFRAAQLRLQRVGENFVNNARLNGAYKDHTGNLRSSVGYVILSNGIQVDANFHPVPGAAKLNPGLTDQVTQIVGPAKAQQVIDDIAKKYPGGLVLIVVAGMEYAAAVEAKGFDVLTGSSLIAKEDLRKSFEELQKKVNSKF
jgi:hypothetical protein